MPEANETLPVNELADFTPEAEAAEQPLVTEQAEEADGETFRDFTRRRADEISGKAEERRLSAEAQAAAIADAILPLTEKLDAISADDSETPRRDEQGRFAPAETATPTDELAQARWQGRHDLARENLGQNIQKLMQEDAELAEAADRIEVSAPLLHDLEHVISEVRNGPEVFKFLVTNPQHFEEMKNPQALVALVGRISAALEFGTTSARPEPATTRAPKPPEPVTRPGGKKVDDINDPALPFKDFVRVRNAQLARRS